MVRNGFESKDFVMKINSSITIDLQEKLHDPLPIKRFALNGRIENKDVNALKGFLLFFANTLRI